MPEPNFVPSTAPLTSWCSPVSGTSPSGLSPSRPWPAGYRSSRQPLEDRGRSSKTERIAWYTSREESTCWTGASPASPTTRPLGNVPEAVGADIDQVPLLSLPETTPVVGGLLRDVKGRVLDAGCGPNPALSILLGRDPGRHLVAVDIGLGTVRLARAVAARSNVPVRVVVADVEALPFRDAAFAGIACDDTIEHLPHDRQGVHELGRVLVPTGRAVIATPNRHSAEVLWRKGADLLRRQPKPASAYYAASSHLREYTWASLERIVRPELMVRRRSAVGWSGGWKRRLASRLTSTPPLRR